MRLQLLPGEFAICRLPPHQPVPDWAAGSFCSITRTAEELSIVCEQHRPPPNATTEPGWRALKVEGPLDFALTGILASLAGPLAAAGIPIFALSTFDTDYVLVKHHNLPAALAALSEAGHEITGADMLR